MRGVARIERRRRIARRERRRRGLAEDGRARLFQHRHYGRIGARPPSPVDRRAHFRRKIGGVDDVLDADGDAAQRTCARRTGVLRTADERADGLVMLVGRLTGPGNRVIGRKIAVVDTALEFGERHHRHFSPNETGPLLRTRAGSGKRSGYAPPPARPEMTGAPPFPTRSG